MFAAIARLANTRPRRVLVFVVIAFALFGALGAPVSGLLTNGNDSFLDPNSTSIQATDRIEDATGQDAVPSVIAIMKIDDTAAISEATNTLKADKDVAQVVGGPTMGKDFVSKNGTKTYVAAFYRSSASVEKTTIRLSDKLDEIKGVTVGGIGPAFKQVGEQVEKDLIKAELIAFPLLFVVALWVFRSAISALLPLLVGGLTIVTTLTLLRGINEILDISVFALNLVTGLGLGLAIDYSLFLVSRYREELERSGPGPEAIRRTVATAGRTVAYSAVTVASAGVALMVFPLRFLYSMGIGVALVSLVSAAVALIVLPSVFAVLGHRVNSLALKRWHVARQAEARAEHTGFWYRLSQFVMHYPVRIALIGTALLLALGAPFLGIKFTGVDATVLPDSASARTADTILRSEFTNADNSPIVISAEAPASAKKEVAGFTAVIAERNHVKSVADPVFVGHDTWRIDVTTEGRGLADSSTALVKDIRSLYSPFPILVGGESAQHVDQLSSIGSRLPLALAIIAVGTIVTLFLMTGSVVLPIKALVMNVLTVSATFGILVMIFQDGRLQGFLGYTSQGALESTQPVFLFAVAFGLSTDYAVFLLTRIKEARDAGASDKEAVALGIQRTGRIVTAAALLFAIAIGTFATSEIIFIKELGIGTATAVLIDATIVRALLVPSLMALLGHRNWWAPDRLRIIHRRIGLSEG
ncbi:MAG: MMPL family transporter [Aeromicrobium sp.]